MARRFASFLLMLLLLLPLSGRSEEVSPSLYYRLLDACFINPQGGSYVHLNPMCPSVSDRYLPLTQIVYTEEAASRFSPCRYCALEGTDDLEDWVAQYGPRLLWDYAVLAAFSAKNDWMYAFDPSLKPCLPQPGVIASEEAVSLALRAAPAYGNDITQASLSSLVCIASSYRKPDRPTGLWSEEGTWVVSFVDTSSSLPEWAFSVCLNAQSGTPEALLTANGEIYVGSPKTATRQESAF